MPRETTANCALASAQSLSHLPPVSLCPEPLRRSPSFFPPPASESAGVAGRTPSQHAKRSRLVRLDANVLASRIAPLNADNDADRAERAARLPDTLRLNLFDDVTPTLKRTSVSARAAGGYTWEGIVPGRAIHEALLSVKNGQISGRVQLNNKLFSIDPSPARRTGSPRSIAAASRRRLLRACVPKIEPRARSPHRSRRTAPARQPRQPRLCGCWWPTRRRRARKQGEQTAWRPRSIKRSTWQTRLMRAAVFRCGFGSPAQWLVAYSEGNGTPSQFGNEPRGSD